MPWVRISEVVGQRSLSVTADTYPHMLADEKAVGRSIGPDVERALRRAPQWRRSMQSSLSGQRPCLMILPFLPFLPGMPCGPCTPHTFAVVTPRESVAVKMAQLPS